MIHFEISRPFSRNSFGPRTKSKRRPLDFTAEKYYFCLRICCYFHIILWREIQTQHENLCFIILFSRSSTLASNSFLDDMKYTDLVLEVNGTTFHCHKFMLAGKSDVFDAMFSHHFEERFSNKVVITDLEPDAILEMLRFIYTGKVHNMETVNKLLLISADKYNIIDLKESCEKSLCNSMTVENVCSLLLLARDRVSQELKRRAVDFISQNIEAVTNAEGWQDLVREPSLMTDVVRAMGPKT